MRRNGLYKNWTYSAIFIALCLWIVIGLSPVAAVTNSALPLTQGQTVFLGEENVVITSAAIVSPNVVGYFIATSTTPVATETLSATDSFTTAAHTGFTTEHLGDWYVYNTVTGVKGALAFTLAAPTMTVQVTDSSGTTCDGKDRTGTTVMYPLALDFKINLGNDVVTTRGVAVPLNVDINLTDGTNNYPCVNGACDGSDPTVPLSLKDFIINANPFFRGQWLTGSLDSNRQYFTAPGEYSFSSTCQINGLVINSPTNTVTLAEPSVTVNATPDSIKRGNQATIMINGEANTHYYFGIIECPLKMTGANCDQPPWIVPGSAIKGSLDTTAATRAIIDNVVVTPSCCGGLAFKDVVPPVATPPGPYYAEVTTDCDGVASFLVGSNSNVWKLSEDPTYTLHVQKTAAQTNTEPFSGTTLYAESTLTLTKGAVTIQFYDASDASQASITEAYLGDYIGIKGTNTDTSTTFLYMTGPCQPECGGSLFPNPYPNGLLGPGPDVMPVEGGSWVIKSPPPASVMYWDTSKLPINPGTYTIYAISNWPTGCPNVAGCPDVVTCGGGKCELLNCPNCLVYAVGTITLKKPELDANVTSIERCCCPGYPCGVTIDNHPMYVSGHSLGNTPYWRGTGANRVLVKDINVWVFGKGKVGDKKFLNWKETVPCDGVLNFTIPWRFPRDTNVPAVWNVPLCTLDAGTYDMIIQTKGYNQQYDVLYEDDTIGDILSGVPVEQNKRWILTTYPVNAIHDQPNPNQQISQYPDYAKLVQVEGPGYKLGTEALNGLIRGLEDPNIDDEYVHIQFTIKDKSCMVGTDFEADRTYGNNPLTVRFTDKSYNATSWLWDFGDGNTSTEQNPIYTYTKDGRYTVSLTTNGDASAKQVKNDYIRVAQGPSAKFTYTPEDVPVGDEVQFTDLSAGGVTSWSWDFGDGSTSPLESPVHTFTTPGEYTVTLTVSDVNGVSGTASKTIVVAGSSTPVVADFTTTVTGGTTVTFKDKSTGYGIKSWLWTFGDGSTSTLQNPVHVYSKEGTYTVTLTVSNGGYENTVTSTVGIR